MDCNLQSTEIIDLVTSFHLSVCVSLSCQIKSDQIKFGLKEGHYQSDFLSLCLQPWAYADADLADGVDQHLIP